MAFLKPRGLSSLPPSDRPEFLSLRAPPRDVPTTLRLRLAVGGFLGFMGWFLLGFCGIFVWVFVGSADLTGWRFQGSLATATGRVTSCERTRASVGGSKTLPGAPIFANHFTFAGATGDAVSYATGICLGKGDTVTVEHPPGRPDLARIQGMRRAMFGPSAVLVCIFPLIGLAFVLSVARTGRRQARLLERGRLGWAELVRRERTNDRINDRPVWKLTFALETDGGERHEIVARTHLPDRITDEAREPAIYAPDNPRAGVLWDLLSSRPRIGSSGDIEPPGVVGTFFVLLPALATLLGHGFWAWQTLR